MTKIDESVFCDHCGIEITWGPIVAGDRHYCCQDCFDDLKCDCRPLLEWDDEHRGGKAGSDFLEF